MQMLILDKGQVESRFKPAPYYAEIAAAGRSMGMDIEDDDYDRIEALLEGNSLKLTTVQSSIYEDPGDCLVNGYLPYENKYTGAGSARFAN